MRLVLVVRLTGLADLAFWLSAFLALVASLRTGKLPADLRAGVGGAGPTFAPGCWSLAIIDCGLETLDMRGGEVRPGTFDIAEDSFELARP